MINMIMTILSEGRFLPNKASFTNPPDVAASETPSVTEPAIAVERHSMTPLRGTMPPDTARRMRITATLMLVLMAGLFILSKQYLAVHPSWGYLHAFSEAAMVGGIADWFAVTALFRHPMGIPIPHTAIIPNNKDRIADTMAQFLRTNFLIPSVVARRMQNMNMAKAVGGFLVQPAQSTQSRIGSGAAPGLTIPD